MSIIPSTRCCDFEKRPWNSSLGATMYLPRIDSGIITIPDELIKTKGGN